MPYAFFDVGSLSKGNELLFSPGLRIGRAGGRKQRQKVDARRRRGMSGAAASGNPFRAVVKILIFECSFDAIANAQFEGAVSLNACRVEGGLLLFGFGSIHDRCVLPGLGAAPAAGPVPNRTVSEYKPSRGLWFLHQIVMRAVSCKLGSQL